MQALHTTSVFPSPLDALCKPPRSVFSYGVASRPLPRRLRFISASATNSAPTQEQDRVIIMGIGLVSVFGNDVDASYYEKLLTGESDISLIGRFDASKFPTRFGGQIRGFTSEGYNDGKNDRRLDDCLRYLI